MWEHGGNERTLFYDIACIFNDDPSRMKTSPLRLMVQRFGITTNEGPTSTWVLDGGVGPAFKGIYP